MPTYKLTHFNLKARAEPTRYLFAIAGVEFEDVRIGQEEWKKLKETEFAPLKQLPILEGDGEKLYQSNAIHQFVTEETGLLGSSTIERGKILAIVETTRDLSLKLAESKFEKDEAKKVSLADVMVFNFYIDKMGLGLDAPFHNFPVMKEYIKRFADIPGIQSWLQKRPSTTF